MVNLLTFTWSIRLFYGQLSNNLLTTMHHTQTQPTVAFEEAAILLRLETSQEIATNTACLYSSAISGYCFRQYSQFDEAERCNNLLYEDIDQASDPLITAAETIQLII